MKKWFYERSRFSEFKSNTTYHKLLQMSADEFTKWARLLRSEVTEQWDVHGTPPVIGKDEDGLITKFKKLKNVFQFRMKLYFFDNTFWAIVTVDVSFT